MLNKTVVFQAIKQLKITGQIVEKFAQVVGDMNPVHLSQQAAEKTRFGKRIAHGMIGICFMQQLIPSNYQLMDFGIKFKRPVYLDDCININVQLYRENQQFFALITKTTEISETKEKNHIVTEVKGKWKELC